MPLSAAYLAEDRGPVVTITNTVFISLATITVILRFLARKLKKIQYGPDDFLVLLAFLLTAALYALAVVSVVKLGIGRHVETLSESEVEEGFKVLYFVQIFYVLTPPTIKLSLLFLYKRIFVGKTFIRVVHAHIAIVLLFASVATFFAIFNCSPIDAFWTTKGHCLSFRSFAIGYAIVNIATDATIWALPIPMLWKLQLPIMQRIGLILIFILGLCEIAAALSRLVASMLVLGSLDPTYDYAPGHIWSLVEPTVGIMCVCLPTTRVIFKTFIYVPESWRNMFTIQSSRRTTTTADSHVSRWQRTGGYNEILVKGATPAPKSDEGDLEAFELNNVKISEEGGVKIIKMKRDFGVKKEDNLKSW